MINIQSRFLNVILGAICFFSLSTSSVYAQENAASEIQDSFKLERIAVVNSDKVVRDAKATEPVRAFIDDKR